MSTEQKQTSTEETVSEENTIDPAVMELGKGIYTYCSTCHGQDDWRASPVSMTFTNRSASTLCNIATRRRGGTEALATLLRTSPHVRWAVAEGDVPGGRRLRLAPPGNLQTWLATIDRWVAAGASCN